jgi:hypothetical protein
MFTRQHMQDIGFIGFIPLLGDLARVPERACIYTVVWDGSTQPTVTERSTGGRFKQKDPTVDVAAAQAKLIPGCETLYIGRAKNGRDRLELLARFGRGQPVGHWGGRYLWQLQEPTRLLVAWREEADPVRAEAELLDEFESHFGRLPYANLVRGRRREPTAA